MSFCEEYGKECTCLECKQTCVDDPCSGCDGIHVRTCKSEPCDTLLEDVSQ